MDTRRGGRGRGSRGSGRPGGATRGAAAGGGAEVKQRGDRPEGGRWISSSELGAPPPQAGRPAEGRGRRDGGDRNANRNGRGGGNNRNNNNSNRSNNNNRGGASVFPEHMSEEEAEDGLRRGILFAGKLRISAKNRKMGFVSAEGGVMPRDILIDGERERNRAWEGDTVVVELLPETEWVATAETQTPSNDMIIGAAFARIGLTEKQPTHGEGGQNDDDADASTAVHEALWRPQVQYKSIKEREKEREEAGSGAAGSESSVVSSCSLCELGKRAKQANLQPKGKVVRIKESRHRMQHMGCLVPLSPLVNGGLNPRDAFVVFRPADQRYPHLLIPRGELPFAYLETPEAFVNSIFLALLPPQEWPVHSKMPAGCAVRCVGEAGCIEPETQALLAEHQLDHGDFPADVMDSLQGFMEGTVASTPPPPPGGTAVGDAAAVAAAVGDTAPAGGVHTRGSTWQIPASEIASRRDLRNSHRIFSIDPTTAKDLDDALHITPLGTDGTPLGPGQGQGRGEVGEVEIGVHIADVSYFIQPGSALDREARRRATSVYLVQKVIPMLPPLLCEELCSLNPNVDRLAFSAIWRMKTDGTLVEGSQWFGRTVIRSCCKLDYATAQKMIEGDITPGMANADISHALWDTKRRPVGHSVCDVVNDVILLNSTAKQRRKKRYAHGALALNRVKLSFKLEAQTGNPESFFEYPIRDSNRLVEEYMLLANYLVAQQLLMDSGDLAMLRMHPPPQTKGMQDLKESLEKHGVFIDISSAAALQTSLLRLEPRLFEIVTMMATIPMEPAQYIAAGDSEQGLRHYALNIPYYTHFTSPIRRYADVMVHRLLTATLEASQGPGSSSNGGEAGAEAGAEEEQRRRMLYVASSCGYGVEEVSSVAKRCNEMKMASKMAQERSDVVFLAVYLLSHPCKAKGTVVSLGAKAFTVSVPSLGIDSRIYLDKIDGTTSTFDEAKRVITLTATSQALHNWTTVDIELFSTVEVACSAKKVSPIQVQVDFVRPLVTS